MNQELPCARAPREHLKFVLSIYAQLYKSTIIRQKPERKKKSPPNSGEFLEIGHVLHKLPEIYRALSINHLLKLHLNAQTKSKTKVKIPARSTKGLSGLSCVFYRCTSDLHLTTPTKLLTSATAVHRLNSQTGALLVLRETELT